MSIEGIHWAQKMRNVCPYRKALLFALGERHNKDTQRCCPDQEMLALDAGMSQRTVRKYIAMLEADGLLQRHMKATKAGRVTHYTLNLSVTEPQSVVRVRQDVPLASEGGSGAHVPDGSGACVPVHKNTNLHESSVPKGTAQNELFPKPKKSQPPKSPETAKAELVTKAELQKAGIFSIGLALLKAEGVPEAAARKFLGGLVKRSSLAIVHAAVQAAANDPPIDARGWLTGAVAKKAGAAGIRQPAVAAKPGAVPADLHGNPVDWDAAVARYVRRGIWSKALGGRPDDHDYRGPIAPLEAILANGKFGLLNVPMIKHNIARLRAEQPTA